MARIVACAAFACLLGVVVHAAEGVLIVSKVTSGGSTRTSEVQIEKNRMRADVGDITGSGKQIVLFDSSRQVLDIIYVDRKTYNELTKADIDRFASQVQDLMGQVQSMMANMPPEQRAQMEAMMRGRGASMPAMSPAKTTYTKTGTDKVGRWTCDKYEGTRDGQKVADLCTVDPNVLGLSAADADIMRQLAGFFSRLIPQGSPAFDVGRMEDQGFSGIPVRSASTIAGRETTTELTDVSRQNFADSLFTVPAGFQKVDFMPAMGRGRGGQ